MKLKKKTLQQQVDELRFQQTLTVSRVNDQIQTLTRAVRQLEGKKGLPTLVDEIDYLIPHLESLQKQATEEHSHYYTGNMLARTIGLLTRVKESLK